MSELKVGDRIRYVSDMFPVECGTVAAIHETTVAIEFDYDMGGHAGSGIYNKLGMKKLKPHLLHNCWNFTVDTWQEFLEKIETYEVDLI